MNRIARLLASMVVLAVGGFAMAGEDVGGYISDYTKNYNATEYQVGAKGAPPKVETVEGDMTMLRYFHESPDKTSTSTRARPI